MTWPIRVLNSFVEAWRRRAAAPPRPDGWRRRFGRWTRTAVAFLATLTILVVGYVVVVATQGRVPVDLNAPMPEPPAGGSTAIAAAALLLSTQRDDPGAGGLFLPNRRLRRTALFEEGAAEAVGEFVEVVARRRDRDSDLAQAAALLAAPLSDLSAVEAQQRYVEAREALRRFNARSRKPERAVEPDAETLSALARAVASACGAHERALREAAIRGRFGPADPGAEAAFFRSRGEAYAWARLLRAFVADGSQASQARLRPATEALLAPLNAAAAFEPQVLFNAPAGGVAPNHLERLATDLAAASRAAWRLDKLAAPS